MSRLADRQAIFFLAIFFRVDKKLAHLLQSRTSNYRGLYVQKTVYQDGRKIFGLNSKIKLLRFRIQKKYYDRVHCGGS